VGDALSRGGLFFWLPALDIQTLAKLLATAFADPLTLDSCCKLCDYLFYQSSSCAVLVMDSLAESDGEDESWLVEFKKR
jgi:hypothetical protein